MAQSNPSFHHLFNSDAGQGIHHLFNSDAEQETLHDQQPQRPCEDEFASAYSQIQSSTQTNHSIPKPPNPINFPNPVNDDRCPAPVTPGLQPPEPEVLCSMDRHQGTDEATVCGLSSDELYVNELPQSYLPQNGPNTSNQPSVAVLPGLRSIQVAAREAVTAAERHANAVDAFVTSFVQYMKTEQNRNASDSSNA